MTYAKVILRSNLSLRNAVLAVLGTALTFGWTESRAAFVYPIDCPGSIGTHVTGVNKTGEITGAYSEPTIGKGFVAAPPNYVCTAPTTFIADPSADNTVPGGIDDKGWVTGEWTDLGSIFHGFVRKPNGNISIYDAAGANSTYPQSIGVKHYQTGSFSDTGGLHGFYREPNGPLTPFDVPGSSPGKTNAVSIDRSDYAVTGSYLHPNGSTYGFVWNFGSNAWTVKINPDPLSNHAESTSIAQPGIITGWYSDSTGLARGFMYRTATNNYTLIDPPAASGGNGTFPTSIDKDVGIEITGYYIDATPRAHGFKFVPPNTYSYFDVAAGTSTFPISIRKGMIAGYYLDSNNTDHGFVCSPPDC